jgi:hypothetical protein
LTRIKFIFIEWINFLIKLFLVKFRIKKNLNRGSENDAQIFNFWNRKMFMFIL